MNLNNLWFLSHRIQKASSFTLKNNKGEQQQQQQQIFVCEIIIFVSTAAAASRNAEEILCIKTFGRKYEKAIIGLNQSASTWCTRCERASE
jgi:hypothetical protein